MNRKIILTLVGCCFISLAGCDNKKASESNFKTALNDYHANNELCLRNSDIYYHISPSFPVEVFDDDYGFTTIMKKMSALADAGLVIKSEENAEPNSEKNNYKRGEARKYTFKLTSLGKKSFKEKAGLCYATMQVADIKDFTEPASSFGMKVSQVRYSVKGKKISDWIKNENIKKEFPGVNGFIKFKNKKERISQQATLVLTNKGWIHEHLHNRG